MLRIKLIKTGKKDRPMWRVIVVEKTKTGQGRVTDYIGNYNPHNKPKIFNIDLEKFEKWIKVGAQPTDAVLRLKGKLIDKNKDYQKIVKAKVYKTKKAEETESKKATKQESKEEKTEEIAEEVKEETVKEEPKKEEKEGVVEEKVEEKNKEPKEEIPEKEEKEAE